MMKNRVFLILCIVFLLVASSMVFAAASARIVTDTLAPSCTSSGGKYCKDLYIEADAESAVKYTITDVKAGNYTLSFMYKLQSGKFEFSLTPVDIGFIAVPLSDTTWKRFSESLEIASDQPTVVLHFKAKDAQAKFWLDELQLTLSPEPTKFNNFKYETGCCAADFCWTGDSCIHSKFYERNVSMPPLGWTLADFRGELGADSTFLEAPNGYRCINGSWKFTRIKFTPLFDGAGYCPDDEQCFQGADSGLPADACVDSGNFIEYGADNFYCYRGNWTTRTKEIALQLLNMTDSGDTYTIFCDDFNRVLNSKGLGDYRDYVGDNIYNMLIADPSLVNEFCVLDLNGQVIVGASLNQELNVSSEISSDFGALSGSASSTTASRSFLQVIKGSDKNDYCDAAIENPDGAYNVCSDADVFYNAKLKSVLFTKMQNLPSDDRQAVPMSVTVNFIDRIIESIKSVFRNLLGIAGLANSQLEAAYKSQLDFVAKAGSFNKLYLSFSPDGPDGGAREIKAVRETRASIQADGIPEIKTFLSAEYHNYQTEVCTFFYKHNYPYLRAQISKLPNIRCTPVILDENNWMYSVYVEEPFFAGVDTVDGGDAQVWIGDSDSFWNDITAAIRTQSPPVLPDSVPPLPTFEFTPETPVVGTIINFSLTLPAEQEREIIARTWDFGDGEKASSAYNVTTFHRYAEARESVGYPVSVWVMDRNFNIRKSDIQYVVVNLSPQIGMVVGNQSREDRYMRRVIINFTITGGNRPYYNVNVDWDDGTNTEFSDDMIDGTGFFSVDHSYALSEFESGTSLMKKKIIAEGYDRDGVYFSISDEVPVMKETRPTVSAIVPGIGPEIPSAGMPGGIPESPASSPMGPAGGPAAELPVPIGRI